MGRPCLWTPVLSDAATVTGTASVSGDYGIANLLTVQPTETYKTASTCVISVDLGASLAVRGAWLGYTNADSTATLRCRATDTLANITSAPSLDTGVDRHWPGTGDYSSWDRTHGWVLLDSPVAYRYWQFDVVNGSAYEIGRFYMSLPKMFPLGLDMGSRITYQEQARRTRSLGGSLYSAGRGKWREATFSVRAKVAEDELIEAAESIDRERGVSRDLLLMLDSENPNLWMDRSLYGVFSDLQPTETIRRGLWGKSYAFEEMELP